MIGKHVRVRTRDAEKPTCFEAVVMDRVRTESANAVVDAYLVCLESGELLLVLPENMAELIKPQIPKWAWWED